MLSPEVYQQITAVLATAIEICRTVGDEESAIFIRQQIVEPIGDVFSDSDADFDMGEYLGELDIEEALL